MKHKRVWSEEAKKAAGERMAKRWEYRRQERSKLFMEGTHAGMTGIPRMGKLGSPIENPILDVIKQKYTPIPVIEGETAVAVEEPITGQYPIGDKVVTFTANHTIVIEKVPEAVRDESRVGSHEVRLIVRTDGQMVSTHGPCVCGKSKREWHKICLKENSNAA